MKQQVIIYGAPAAGGPQNLLPEEITLEAGQQCSFVLVLLPGTAETAPTLRVRLTGPGAAFELYALCIGSGSDRLSLRTEVEHLCPDAASDQLIRCIAGGNSRLAFDGLIKVHPDARKTEALQTSNSLLLTDTAKVFSSPQLEIYADDVKCSHGATTGSLNEEEQFYMRSRGISLEQARFLQLRSFVHPILGAVEDEKKREELTALVEQALTRL